MDAEVEHGVIKGNKDSESATILHVFDSRGRHYDTILELVWIHVVKGYGFSSSDPPALSSHLILGPHSPLSPIHPSRSALSHTVSDGGRGSADRDFYSTPSALSGHTLEPSSNSLSPLSTLLHSLRSLEEGVVDFSGERGGGGREGEGWRGRDVYQRRKEQERRRAAFSGSALEF